MQQLLDENITGWCSNTVSLNNFSMSDLISWSIQCFSQSSNSKHIFPAFKLWSLNLDSPKSIIWHFLLGTLPSIYARYNKIFVRLFPIKDFRWGVKRVISLLFPCFFIFFSFAFCLIPKHQGHSNYWLSLFSVWAFLPHDIKNGSYAPTFFGTWFKFKNPTIIQQFILNILNFK